MMTNPVHFKSCLSLVAGLLAFIVLTVFPVHATHLRGMTIFWQPVSPGSHTIQFNIQYSQRWSYPSASRCPGSGLCPQLGASIPLFSANTANQGSFDFGDGSASLNPGNTPFGTVTSINNAEDWYVAAFKFTHTYSDCDVHTAHFDADVRIDSIILGHDTREHVEVKVSPCAASGSAVVSVPAIQAIPLTEITGFSLSSHIAKADPGDSLSYRLASAEEMYGASTTFSCRSGSSYRSGQPPGLSIDSATGRVSWDTSRITAATDAAGNPCFNAPGTGDLWAVQFIVTVTDRNHNVKGTVPVDLILQFVKQVGSLPTLKFNPPGPLSVAVGNPVIFTATGDSTNPGTKITLNASGVPAGAWATNLNHQLPPALTSNFSWTPTAADIGNHVVTYTATDENSQQAVNSITINVIQAPALQISTGSLPPATASQPYSSLVTGAGGTPSYQWSADLPTDLGLSLSPATGEITGTPRRSGSYQFNVKIRDSQGQQTSKTFTLQINAAPIVALEAFLLEPQRATVGTPVKLVAALRSPAGKQLSAPELPKGLSLRGEISGNPVEFTSEADGRFSATVTFRSTGNITVLLHASGEGFEAAGQGIVNVAARFAYTGGSILIDLGQLKAGNEACKQLPFVRDQEGEVPLRYRLLQSTPAWHTLFLMRGGDSYRPDMTIPLSANDQLEVCLHSNRWASSSQAKGEPWITLITSGDAGDHEITQVRLRWQVEERSFWERWGWLLLALLILAIIAFLVYGYIKPQRFPRDLALTFVPSYDELDQSPQPVRQWRGVGIGFYRDAHAFLHSDFRISGKSRGAIGKLSATKQGVWITPAANTIFREVQPAEWEEISHDGRMARATVVYRIGESGPFFRLTTSTRRR